MEKNKKLLQNLFIVVMLMLTMKDAVAQDLHFSQFYEAPLLRNPALAGLYEGDMRLQSIYRNQWSSVSFPYKTISMNGEYKFAVGKGEDFLTVGGQIFYDKAGTVSLTTMQVLPVVNFHKSLSEARNTYLSLGFMGGIVDRRLNNSAVTTNNQYNGYAYNGALPTGERFLSGYKYMDMSVGMSFNTSVGGDEQHDMFIAAGYHHLNKPTNTFYRDISHLPKVVLSAGFNFHIDPYNSIIFNADYLNQNPFKTIIGGLMYSKKPDPDEGSNFQVQAGIYCRLKDAIIPVLKLTSGSYALGFSYDISTSTISSASMNKGGFEMSLTYLLLKPRDYAPVHCPRF